MRIMETLKHVCIMETLKPNDIFRAIYIVWLFIIPDLVICINNNQNVNINCFVISMDEYYIIIINNTDCVTFKYDIKYQTYHTMSTFLLVVM